MKLVFDTETTGLARFDLPLNHPSQPNIVQLGMLILDEKDEIVNEVGLLIKPEGFIISAEMTAIHGVSQERAEKYGVRIKFAIELYLHFFKCCDIIIGHNLKFDKFLIDCELSRLNVAGNGNYIKSEFCTMLTTTPIMNLTQKNGRPKWPKLSECYSYFFNEPLIDAHDALTDVRACARVYKHLINPISTLPKAPAPLHHLSLP
jgi:DNA polymerase-3 subunit epsilon